MPTFLSYFCFVVTIGFSLASSSGSSCREKKLAFFSTDGKADGNLALGLARHTNKYHRAHIFHDGVSDPYENMLTTENTQRYMENTLQRYNDNDVMTRIHYEGESPLIQEDGTIKKQDHEHSIFLGNDNDVEASQNVHDGYDSDDCLAFHLFKPRYLKENLVGPADEMKRGDYFSHAPVPKVTFEKRLQSIADNGVQLDNFHHILGYNTRQDLQSSEGASEATQEYATSLKTIVNQHHPNARVIITNNFHNLGGAEGGLQPYSKLEKVLPPHLLNQIGPNESFYTRQMGKVYLYLLQKGRNPVPFEGLTGRAITQEEVWRARRNLPNDPQATNLRHNILYAARANLKKLKRGSHLWERLCSIIKGIEGECLGLACDFNHQAIVHEAIKAAQEGDANAFVPICIDENIKMRYAEPGEQDHGVTPHLDFKYDTAKGCFDDYIASFQQ